MSIAPRPISPTPLVIRAAETQDCHKIAVIYNEAIENGGITMDNVPRTTADIQALLSQLSQREALLVAQLSEHVIGWGIVKRYSDRAGYQVCCETSVYLTFSETGKGYGKVLQQTLLSHAESLGYYHIVAKILAANESSIRFHQRFGFTIVGIQYGIGYLNGIWHDVVILQYQLPKYLSDIS